MGSNYQDVVLAFDKVVDKKEAWLSTEIPGIQDYQAAVMACVGKPHGEFANKLVEIAGKEATSLEAAEKILTLVDSVLGENSPQAFRVKLAIAEKNFEVKKKQPDAEAQAQAYLDLLTEAMTRYNTLVCDAEHGSGADVLMAPEVTQAAYHVVIRSLNAEKYADLMDHLDDLIEKHKTHGQLQQAASDMTLANQPQEATIAPYSYYLFLGGIYEALRTGKVNVEEAKKQKTVTQAEETYKEVQEFYLPFLLKTMADQAQYHFQASDLLSGLRIFAETADITAVGKPNPTQKIGRDAVLTGMFELLEKQSLIEGLDLNFLVQGYLQTQSRRNDISFPLVYAREFLANSPYAGDRRFFYQVDLALHRNRAAISQLQAHYLRIALNLDDVGSLDSMAFTALAEALNDLAGTLATNVSGSSIIGARLDKVLEELVELHKIPGVSHGDQLFTQLLAQSLEKNVEELTEVALQVAGLRVNLDSILAYVGNLIQFYQGNGRGNVVAALQAFDSEENLNVENMLTVVEALADCKNMSQVELGFAPYLADIARDWIDHDNEAELVARLEAAQKRLEAKQPGAGGAALLAPAFKKFYRLESVINSIDPDVIELVADDFAKPEGNASMHIYVPQDGAAKVVTALRALQTALSRNDEVAANTAKYNFFMAYSELYIASKETQTYCAQFYSGLKEHLLSKFDSETNEYAQVNLIYGNTMAACVPSESADVIVAGDTSEHNEADGFLARREDQRSGSPTPSNEGGELDDSVADALADAFGAVGRVSISGPGANGE